MSLEPLPVLAACAMEPIDLELLNLIAADDVDTLLPMGTEDYDKEAVDSFASLNPISTPTTVDAFDSSFSKREIHDLMTIFAPQTSKKAAFVRSCSETATKINKRSKKCTYATRRREVTFLRQEAILLEKRLDTLRKDREASNQIHERAACEMYNLAKSQTENKRLRALVLSQEAAIRQADAYTFSVNHSH